MVDPIFKSFFVRTRGASHIEAGRPCEDYVLNKDTETYSLSVVCDGHGDSDTFRADRGSRYAAEAFRDCIEESFHPCEDGSDTLLSLLNECSSSNQRDLHLQHLAERIVIVWRQKIMQDYINEPFTKEELKGVSEKAKIRYQNEDNDYWVKAYGTTLIGIVFTKDFWFGIQKGDGKCECFDKKGIANEPIPWDNRCFLNATTSMCQSDAAQTMKFFFSKELPAAVFIATDGVDDSYPSLESRFDFYRTVIKSFTIEEFDKAVKELEDHIPVMSRTGSRDDISIGGIMNLPFLKEFPTLFQKRKKIWLKIVRITNTGSIKIDEDSLQKATIEAVPSLISLRAAGLTGYIGSPDWQIKILQVNDGTVLFELEGKKRSISIDGFFTMNRETKYDQWARYDIIVIRAFTTQ